MAQKKAHEVDGWLRRPDPRFSIVLIYGPDHGMVSERSRTFAAQTGIDLDDPFSVTRLDASEADQPGRLADEAFTVPMFAARRLLWVRNIGQQKTIADAVKLLCATPPPDATILMEAGDLKKGTGLRAAVEAAATAIALPCYADEARDLDRLIDEALGQSGIRLSMDARALLKRNLGGDRMGTRGEIEKLLLYTQGRPSIEADDVLALTGDVAGRSVDDVVDAALSGQLGAFDLMFQRHVLGGGHPYLLLAATMRQLQALQIMRATLDQGRANPSDIVNGARPPVFFSRKKAVEGALRRMQAPMISRALERLSSALLESRRRPELGEALI
ncbi:DNA polymerase III subunit delta, partial [Salmonella enterica subsp. enterica]|nr:DNA polymerase III subunit delta [Salmonella enterica subsp. enterica]